MRFTLQRYVCNAAWNVSRTASKSPLPLVGIGCLSLSLVGCSGVLEPLQQQQLSQKGAQNTLYTIQDLGVVGANPNAPGQPLVIANNSWVSGGAAVGAGEHAVLWHDGQMFDIGNPGLGGNSMAYGINESGTASGQTEMPGAGLATTEDFCAFQAGGFSSSPTPCVPFMWTGGNMVPLPTLGGVNGIANGINNSGAIAGYAETTTLDAGCTAPQKYQFLPVIWSHGAIQPLPTGNDTEGVAFSINDHGDVAGASGSCGPLNPLWGFYFNPTRALLWQNGVAIDLKNLGGAFNNMAHDVNNQGQVVGGSDLAGDQTSHAFLWTAATQMQDLGTVSDSVDDDFVSFGLGINNAGEIVGVSASADFSIIRGFIQQNGRLVDLNSLVTGNNSLYLMTACSINAKGEIIGIAFDPNTGETHGYLATPTHGAAASNSSVSRPPVLPARVKAWFKSGRAA